MRNSTHEDEVTRVPGQEEQGWIWTSRGRKGVEADSIFGGIEELGDGEVEGAGLEGCGEVVV